MERVTECLVTKDEREVIAVVLFSWPIGPTTPDGSVPGTVPPGDNIARTRVMLTADPTRKAPMTHGLLNNSSVAQAQDRERPELTRWLFCGQGIHAERGECPTSAMHIGPGHETSGKLDGSREESLSSHPLSALLGETPLVISAHSPSSECVPSAPTYTFQSLPIIPAHPIPTSEGHDGAAPSREGEHPCKAENSALVRLAHSRVALFHSISASLLGALRCCLRLPMTITPTLGPLCDFSAYLLVYVPHRGFSHEGAPLDFRMPLCLGGRSVVCSDAVPVGTPTPGKNWCYALEGLAPVHAPCGVAQGGPVCSLCLEWVLAHQDICLMRQNHHTSTIRVGLCWGSVMLDVSCLLSHRLMPSCLSEAVTALGTFGGDPGHAGDTVECVPPLSCLMLVLALRHAHSQHQDGYP
ncbi:hypothetical protein PAPYR_11204 [Paratrimastix pyriformis]|uniref:Uncharacterized protein n=1 Tax=Paratrimastix pyriformis TaxID=342808 RepID=A0ABQ8UA16_9EUKA|nr:hypothetical protein PAPYR_11204 [Paratrimastix pyriformis]